MIKLKSPREIEGIAASGKILSGVFKKVLKEIKIGVNLKYLNDLADRFIREAGAEPAFFSYKPSGAKHPYGASICTSVNDVIVHGFPNNYKLKNGDVLKLDFGVKYRKFYSDAATTVGVGNISKEAGQLIKAARVALEEAIKAAKIGNHLGDIGFIISQIAKKYDVKVVEGLTGHGIGFNLHEDPNIYNFGERGKGIELKAGMVLAIEPMFAIGTEKIVQKSDESWATKDGSLSSHFEHTMAITGKGPKILTLD